MRKLIIKCDNCKKEMNGSKYELKHYGDLDINTYTLEFCSKECLENHLKQIKVDGSFKGYDTYRCNTCNARWYYDNKKHKRRLE